MKNKGIIITLGVVSAIAIAAYIVYTMMKGKASSSSSLAKKSAVSNAKQAATVAQQAKANPNNAALQAEYLKLGESLVSALLKSNTSAKASTSPTGTPSITVDRSGSYIEKGDASTLYNADGSVKGDLDPSTGMFVNSRGQIVANSDGSPATQTSDGFITESDGSKYTIDGAPIQQYNNGSYAELDSNGKVIGTYADDGTPIQTYENGSYAELDNNGNILGTYTANGDPITDTTASNTPAYDPNADPDADPNLGASGYRSSFGKKTIHSLLKK